MTTKPLQNSTKKPHLAMGERDPYLRTMDTFARTTAKQAHKRATAAEENATEAQRLVGLLIDSRPDGHAGRCCLCGEQARGRYCRQHEELI